MEELVRSQIVYPAFKPDLLAAKLFRDAKRVDGECAAHAHTPISALDGDRIQARNRRAFA